MNPNKTAHQIQEKKNWLHSIYTQWLCRTNHVMLLLYKKRKPQWIFSDLSPDQKAFLLALLLNPGQMRQRFFLNSSIHVCVSITPVCGCGSQPIHIPTGVHSWGPQVCDTNCAGGVFYDPHKTTATACTSLWRTVDVLLSKEWEG